MSRTKTDELKFDTFASFPAEGSEGVLYIATDTDIIYYWDGATYKSTGGGSALEFFVEGESTATPNETIPVQNLVATGAETNIDVAIVPKGTGSFALDVADNLVTGGNKRGDNSIDLQFNRDTNTQVASGNFSFIGGGSNNSASGTYSTTSGGIGNSSTGAASTTSGGSNNSASSTYSTVLGGMGNSASGSYSTVSGGNKNEAHDYGELVGGIYSTISTGSQTTRVETDNLFKIGNGTATTARSDALVIKKNGNTAISGDFTANNINGVGLTTGGVATNYLDETGNYSAPPSGGGGSISQEFLVIGPAQNLTTTATVVNFTSKRYDIGTNFDLTTNRYDIPVNGTYNFDFSSRISGVVAGIDIVRLQVMRNGFLAEEEYYSSGAGGDITVSFNYKISNVGAGEFVNIFVISNQPRGQLISANLRFSGYKLN